MRDHSPLGALRRSDSQWGVGLRLYRAGLLETQKNQAVAAIDGPSAISTQCQII